MSPFSYSKSEKTILKTRFGLTAQLSISFRNDHREKRNPSDEKVPGHQAEHNCASIEAPAPLRSEKTAVKGE
jgi:hypothetical protein